MVTIVGNETMAGEELKAIGKEGFTGPWRSLWMSWRGLDALEVDGGNGSVCILPALQASHTGSGSA
jgi:hypothetical protein